MHFTDPGKNCHFINLHMSFISLRNNSLFWSLCAAAVDYLAKNVSLSTQRRMKLGEHSAVLGLLQVETGQAYWWISNWTSTHVFHQHPSILSAATTRGPSDYEWKRPREIQKSQAVLDFLPIAVWIQKPFHIKKTDTIVPHLLIRPDPFSLPQQRDPFRASERSRGKMSINCLIPNH